MKEISPTLRKPDMMQASTPVSDKNSRPTFLLNHKQPSNGYVIQPSAKVISPVLPSNNNGYVTHSMLNVSPLFIRFNCEILILLTFTANSVEWLHAFECIYEAYERHAEHF